MLTVVISEITSSFTDGPFIASINPKHRIVSANATRPVELEYVPAAQDVQIDGPAKKK